MLVFIFLIFCLTRTLWFSMSDMVFVAGHCGLRRRDAPSAPRDPCGPLGRLGIYPLTLRPRPRLISPLGGASHLTTGGVPPLDHPWIVFIPCSSCIPWGGRGFGPLLGWAELALLVLVRTPGAVHILSAPGVRALLALPASCTPSADGG